MSQRNVRSSLIELFLIVGGILLAFAIDAAWDARSEAREEQLLLGNLKTEFEFTRSELERHHDRWVEARLASERLLQLAAAETAAVPATMDSLLLGFLTPTTYDPRSGSLSAVLEAGGLQLIGNRELRAYLAGWSGVVEELRDNELAMREFILFVITPYLAQRGVPLTRSQALIPGQGLRGDGDVTGWPAELPGDQIAEAAYRDLMRDPEFEALLGTRYIWINVEEFDDAIEYVDELLALLASEID